MGRKRHGIPVILLGMGVFVALLSAVSPWPTSLLIRAVFEGQAAKTEKEMHAYEPAAGIDQKLDVPYGTDGKNTTFDVFLPADSAGPLPTVVWIHGGAWISGDKADVRPYARILASHGYTVVAVNYPVAPEAVYPAAVAQLNGALGFLTAHADQYRIDADRIVIAGDSAGSQYAAQLATMITSPTYAAQLGLTPAISPHQVRGVVLNCGIYDVGGIPDAPGIGGWGFRTALWAYLGTKDWSNTPGGKLMGTLDDVTADFPTTWISGGNADLLTATQSEPLAARLTKLGVDVTSVFYPKDTEPALPHEYQFHLDFDASKSALSSTIAFLDRVTARPPTATQ